ALAASSYSSSALACPVCGQGAPGTESAILVMSGILSLLPLLMAGGIIAWLVVRARAAARDENARSVDGAVDASDADRVGRGDAAMGHAERAPFGERRAADPS